MDHFPSTRKPPLRTYPAASHHFLPARGGVEVSRMRYCLSLHSPGPAEHRDISRCSAIPPHPICKKKMRWRNRGERLGDFLCIDHSHPIISVITVEKTCWNNKKLLSSQTALTPPTHFNCFFFQHYCDSHRYTFPSLKCTTPWPT